MIKRDALNDLHTPFGDEPLNCLHRAYQEGNLIQLILQAHLLVELALTARLREKLLRPEVLDEPRYGRWSFFSKVGLYVGLFNPSKEAEERLFALNKLRNMISHDLESESYCTEVCLPWKAEPHHKPAPLEHVQFVTLMALSDLGVSHDVENTDPRDCESHLNSAQAACGQDSAGIAEVQSVGQEAETPPELHPGPCPMD